MLDRIPEGVVWAIMLLPLGSFSVIALVSFLGLTRDGSWSTRYSGYLTIAAIFFAFLFSLWALDSAIDADGARVGILKYLSATEAKQSLADRRQHTALWR